MSKEGEITRVFLVTVLASIMEMEGGFASWHS
jgi:hypothetical protein